jgi:two-component system, response regulator, stage 0 sporulation protein F
MGLTKPKLASPIIKMLSIERNRSHSAKMSKPVKVLVVDDEQDVEMLFKLQFRKEIRSGVLELKFAFSGNDALNILKSGEAPEIIYMFSDINMPGMSGIELLENVKKEYPEINVSMISAYGDINNYRNAASSGAKEFFTKPIDFDKLRQEIASYFDNQS